MSHANDRSPPDGSYFVLDGPGQAELRVERSRFLALAAPAGDEAAARRHLAEAARRHHDARHIACAWRLGHGRTLRELRSDAAEPAGTAGEPILAALRRAGVTDAAVAVARWFGGVKLGPAGLARAYAAAAAAALAAAAQRRVIPGDEHELLLAYEHQRAVAHLLAAHGGRTLSEVYGEQVRWRVWLPAASRDAFAERLREVTAGGAHMKAPA